MRIGILTGGGDCPGLNAAIRAVVRKSKIYGWDCLGILSGWKGLMQLNARELDLRSVSGILPKGGTILGTSRTNPFKDEEGPKVVQKNIEHLHLDALVAIGGEDTLGVASKLHEMNVPVVGVPKTIDNDLMGTDVTIGFDTAVTVATEAIDRIHTTAESHNRVMIVEVMGRHAGWIALRAGMAGGADVTLIPEFPFKLSEVANLIIRRHNRGKNFSIVAVSEGAKFDEADGEKLITQGASIDEFGHVTLGGIGEVLSRKLRDATGFDARVTNLGHTQRGGTPTAYDRNLATQYGVMAVEMIKQGQFGMMASRTNGHFTSVDLSIVREGIKEVPAELYEVARAFFG
ncbi:MAG: ATP-dependent 6-phosphofructokinase [Candidatus Alcyoniella australis]|nr:ATP-dependent 6-phosphofructokinase [Candidatus Alcyoniella australis]